MPLAITDLEAGMISFAKLTRVTRTLNDKFIEYHKFSATNYVNAWVDGMVALNPWREPTKALQLKLARHVVYRDKSLMLSWTNWYCRLCKEEADADDIPTKFAIMMSDQRSELNVFVRYYNDAGGSVMHSFCIVFDSADWHACREFA